MKFKNYTYAQRLIIRERYKPLMKDLRKGIEVDPYIIFPFDLTEYMSPIEKNMWQVIRNEGWYFFPQVPCGNFFIDFANPRDGRAIEVDGFAYHQDKHKDAEREFYIKNHGYPSFERFTGRESYLFEEIVDELDHDLILDFDD